MVYRWNLYDKGNSARLSYFSIVVYISSGKIAIQIRNKKEIHGIQIGNEEYKISQYADDSTLLLSTIESISESLSLIYEFNKHSGMKLNVAKCEGILLRPLKGYVNKIYGINFTDGAIRCLGIYIGHDKEACYNENWLCKIQY